MIYQLKVTLQRSKPPIWRRILVHKDMTLSELHETLQIAFDWGGWHMHCFEARTTRGKSLIKKYIQIGPQREETYGLVELDYDEEKEKLSNWLVQEKDKLMYVYDFGDDWRHEIVLEKVLTPEVGNTYPHCVKALRLAPEEDSGGFIEEVEEADPKELKEIINDQFIVFSHEITSVPTEFTDETESPWKSLLQLTKEYSELAPWRWLGDDQIFAVKQQETDEYIYCSVLGAMGEEYGLSTFTGESGLRYLRGVFDGTIDDSDALTTNQGISISFYHRNEITAEDYELIKREGFTFRGENNWPMIRSYTPGLYPWFLTEEEAHSFVTILERVIVICKRAKDGLHINTIHESDDCFAQTVEKAGDGIVWRDTRITTIIETATVTPCPLLVSELDVHRLKSLGKRYNTSLEIGVFYSPTPIQEHAEVRPYFPTMFVVAERKRGMMVYHELYEKGDREQSIQQSLLKFINELQAIPREIWMTSETFRILQPILTKLNIKSLQIASPPIVSNIKGEILNQF